MYLNLLDWRNSTEMEAISTQALRSRALDSIPVSFADLLKPEFGYIWGPEAHCPFPLLPGVEWGLASKDHPNHISKFQVCDPNTDCCLMCGAANLIVQRLHVVSTLAESPISSLVRVIHASYFFSILSIVGVAFLLLSIAILPTHFTRHNIFVTAYACAGAIIALVQLINVQDYPKNVCYDMITKGASENLKTCSINSSILEFCYIFTIGLSFQMSVLLHVQIVWGWRMRRWVSSVCFIFNTVLASILVGIIAWQGVQFYSGVACQPGWIIAIGVAHAPLIPMSVTALVLQIWTIGYASKVLLKYRKVGHRKTSSGSRRHLTAFTALGESAKYQWRPLLITLYVTVVDNLSCSMVTSGDARRATPASLMAWTTCVANGGDPNACRHSSKVKLSPLPWWATYIPMYLMLLNGAMATLTEFRWSMLRGWLLIFQNPRSFWKLDEWNGNRPISTVFSVNSRRSAIASPSKQVNVKVLEEETGSTKVDLLSPNRIRGMYLRSFSLASTAISSNATTLQPSELHLSVSTQMSNDLTKPASVFTRHTALSESGSIEKRKRDTFGHNADGFYHHGEEIDAITAIPKVDEEIGASAQGAEITKIRVEVTKDEIDDNKDDSKNETGRPTLFPTTSNESESGNRKTI